MAEIIPFPAIHYNPARIKSLDRVICPPYDVLSPDDQSALYDRDPHNYVRVILNRAEPGDFSNGVYERAASTWREWIADGVLVEDCEPALYEYVQEFDHPTTGQRVSRSSILCALKLEPYSAGVVLPHEETRKKAKEDRLLLMRATRANVEPIYGLYEDPTGEIRELIETGFESGPKLDASVDGEAHIVTRISNPTYVQRIQQALAQKRIWIADGHHRYETALNYRDEQRGNAKAEYVLIALSAFEERGLVVLPTHRLLRNVPSGRMEQLFLQLERYFRIRVVAPSAVIDEMRAPVDEHRFGMVTGSGSFVLELVDETIMDSAVEGHCDAWKRLDVSILQTLVLDRSIGIPAAELATTGDVAYTRSTDEAIESVKTGQFQLAFLLNDPTADEVRQVAAAGDKMPAKSTFFYPKLWSGLVARSLE